MSDDQKQPEADTSRLTFQQKVILPVAALFQDLFKEVPELRSACIVLDWKDDLNKALPPCAWFDETGPVSQRKGGGDAIVGSMMQLMRTFELQCEVGLKLVEAYDQTIQSKEKLLADVEERMNEHSAGLEALAEKGQRAAARARGETQPQGMGQEAGDDPGDAAD